MEKFLKFSARSKGGAGEVEGSTARGARVASFVTSVLGCFTQRGTLRDQKQTLYCDTQENVLELAMKQLIGNFRMFVQFWVGIG